MAPKKAKSKAKPTVVPGTIAVFKNAAKPAQAVPAKKKKKHDPLRPQPAWLFPPDKENPILNPRGKSREEVQKEIDERLAAIKFLEHKSVTAPVKTAPPSELLQLIGAFFASYGFVSTGRIFSLERNARKKLEGWNDQIGEKKFAKNQPDLVKIFKDWRADWEGDSDAETSSSEEDSDDDMAVENEDSDSDDSSADSSEEEEESSTSKSIPKTNGVKVRTKLKEPVKKPISKDKKTTSSSSSATSESESDSENENITTNPVTKAPANAPTITTAADVSSSSSSSDSESASDNESDNSTKPTKDTLSHLDQISMPPPIIPQAASDSSETLKGNSPGTESSSSVSSSSASSSSAESSSSSSDSSSEVEIKTKQPSPKSKPEKKSSSKRKATSPAADQTDNSTTQPSKKFKTTNESFSRIPKDIEIDPRLASNKYVSYDYADKAHRDLVVTKGKGFTKEKNKKKRGAYRGGRIDTEGGKAVKFDD